MSNPNSNATSNLNPKLVHLAQKAAATLETPDVDRVVEILRAQHVEYQRKNVEQFRQQVEAILTKDKGAAASVTGNESSNTTTNDLASPMSRKQRKRKLSDRPPKTTSKTKYASNGTNGDGTHFTNANCSPRPTERYADLGGLSTVLQQIRELVEYPLLRPEVFRFLGVTAPRGVLLRGPPGTGKSHLANAIAGQLGHHAAYFKVSATELVSGMSGESEALIRDLFQAAADQAPAIIFLDELDAIAPKRQGSERGMEKRMVAQLLTSMDCQLAPHNTRGGAPVIVLAATNRPDSLDPALRRAGRFDREILLGVPDEAARESILKTMTQGVRLHGDFDFKVLAKKTPGFVGADIRSLTKEAAVLAVNRIFSNVLLPTTTTTQNGDAASITDIPLTPLTPEELEPLYILMDDFLNAIPLVQPSGQREGFAVKPDVSWNDIGALKEIRSELTLSVLEPIRNPEKFQQLGLSLPAGVLLYGPPGCGKTLLAKAVANESGANFISVKGPELLDKYVGESERAVRLVFERARSSSPCIVFFDELDSLCPKRGSDGGGGGSGVSERVVNQLLTEMDGLESRRSVFVIAATNRPELIDPAMMRPGRLDKLLYVALPSAVDRVSILKAISSKVKFAVDVDLEAIGKSSKANGFSGADCAALLREAGLAVLKEDMENAKSEEDGGMTDRFRSLCIEGRHFEVAFEHVLPSVSRKDQARYDRIRHRMARARTRGTSGELEGEESAPGKVETTPTLALA